MIRLTSFSFEKFPFSHHDSLNKSFGLNRATVSWQSNHSNKSYSYCYRCILKLLIPCYCHVNFLQKDLYQKTRTSRRVIEEKIRSSPLPQNPDSVKISTKIFNFNFFPGLETRISPKPQDLCLPSGSVSKTVCLYYCFRWKICPFVFLASQCDISKAPKGIIIVFIPLNVQAKPCIPEPQQVWNSLMKNSF